ncbi:sulfotransferase [Fodinibius sp. AD559]|uniref:sulfotransferase n=1 Tax=Fodinibius sp. AD559 TaxID=3424179 RepID=UPI004046F1B3
MELKRVFILYSERSGSNLLRVLLGNHPDLAAPVSPQFFDSFTPHVEKFGDLRKKENSIKLISHLIKYANHPFSDWNLDISAEDIYSEFSPRNFIEAVDALYASKAQEEDKSGYVCKERHLFNYSGLVIASLSDINWIFLHRDPRDVVSSWLKNNMLYFTAYEAAQSWKEDQKKCLALHHAYNVSYHQLSYEQLITDTEQTLTPLLKYISLNIEEQCFQNEQDNEEASRNVLWKNLNKPIDSSNKKNYVDILSQKQTLIVESVCKQQMKTLGYQLETDGQWAPAIGENNYQYFNKVKELLNQKIRSNNETSDLLQDRKKLKHELISRL